MTVTFRQGPREDMTMNDELISNEPSDEDRTREFESERQIFTPPIDIFDTEEGLVLLADLPGVTVDSLELQIQDNKLTLFGRVKPLVPENARIVHEEYEVGDYLRSFILSDDVDHERITANFNHGVLKIVLPRAPRTEPRKIEVCTD